MEISNINIIFVLLGGSWVQGSEVWGSGFSAATSQ